MQNLEGDKFKCFMGMCGKLLTSWRSIVYQFVITRSARVSQLLLYIALEDIRTQSPSCFTVHIVHFLYGCAKRRI